MKFARKPTNTKYAARKVKGNSFRNKLVVNDVVFDEKYVWD
jgi:hypothetical protein